MHKAIKKITYEHTDKSKQLAYCPQIRILGKGSGASSVLQLVQGLLNTVTASLADSPLMSQLRIACDSKVAHSSASAEKLVPAIIRYLTCCLESLQGRMR